MDIVSKIEHTVLKADTGNEDVERICQEAKENNFAGVCVPPYFVKKATTLLEKSDCLVVTVVGFPLGYSTTPAKVEETRKAIDEGADEIDMVINIAALKNKATKINKATKNESTGRANVRAAIPCVQLRAAKCCPRADQST